MRRAPTRSACFQPDNYKELTLFANRRALLEDVIETLKSFVDPDGPGEGRVLVRGHRGAGKSMLMRKAIHQVIHDLHVLRVEVDCAETVHGEDAVLRALCRALSDEILGNVNEPELRAQAEMLRRLSDATKVRVKEVKQWSTSLKLGATYKYKLADKVQFEFGLTRAVGKSREVEESSERAVDAAFLKELVALLLEDCAVSDTRVIVFVDNLDQAGYAEIEEDVQRVTDLARYFFTLRKCLVVATMRTEFVSADLAKLYSTNIPVLGMKPEELCEVASKRMESAGARQKKALADVRFLDIAKTLAQWTDNAWGYLTWLAALDYVVLEMEPENGAALVDTLAPLMQQQIPGLHEGELEKIAKAFEKDPNGFLTADGLSSAGIAGDLRDRATKYGALVPDWLLSPDRYMLSPRLHFLTPRASAKG